MSSPPPHFHSLPPSPNQLRPLPSVDPSLKLLRNLWRHGKFEKLTRLNHARSPLRVGNLPPVRSPQIGPIRFGPFKVLLWDRSNPIPCPPFKNLVKQRWFWIHEVAKTPFVRLTITILLTAISSLLPVGRVRRIMVPCDHLRVTTQNLPWVPTCSPCVPFPARIRINCHHLHLQPCCHHGRPLRGRKHANPWS